MTIKAFTYEGFEGAEVFGDDGFVEENIAGSSKSSSPALAEKIVAEAAPPQAAPAPIFSLEELEIAKNLAREEGIRQGYEEARQKAEADKTQAENDTREILQKLNFEISMLAKNNEQKKIGVTDEITKIAFSIAKQVCSKVPNQYVEEEIRSIINVALQKFDRGEKIKIWLNPKNAADLNDKFTQAEVNSDEGLGASDFRLEWQSGFAERNLKKLWEEIEATISRHSSFEEEKVIEIEPKTEH